MESPAIHMTVYWSICLLCSNCIDVYSLQVHFPSRAGSSDDYHSDKAHAVVKVYR
jgi:hypothetical protein